MPHHFAPKRQASRWDAVFKLIGEKRFAEAEAVVQGFWRACGDNRQERLALANEALSLLPRLLRRDPDGAYNLIAGDWDQEITSDPVLKAGVVAAVCSNLPRIAAKHPLKARDFGHLMCECFGADQASMDALLERVCTEKRLAAAKVTARRPQTRAGARDPLRNDSRNQPAP